LSIIHAFLEWVTALLWPATGRRRAQRILTSPVPPQARVRRPAAPRTALPRQRSPYGLKSSLDGEQAALIRPYLVHLEQRRQEERRRALEQAVTTAPVLLARIDPGAGPVRGVYACAECAPHCPQAPDASGLLRKGA
jgi:hypothetical protein